MIDFSIKVFVYIYIYLYINYIYICFIRIIYERYYIVIILLFIFIIAYFNLYKIWIYLLCIGLYLNYYIKRKYFNHTKVLLFFYFVVLFFEINGNAISHYSF